MGLSPFGAGAGRHPISRWYLHPAAGWLAAVLTRTRIRPVHLTACGLALGTIAAALLVWRPELAPAAAALVLAAWFFDRADGQLARRQNTVSAWGAWLDAHVDEVLDVGLHVGVAAAAAFQAASNVPWFLLIAFLAGKYLFMHGLAVEEHVAGESFVRPDRVAGVERSEPPEKAVCGVASLHHSHPSEKRSEDGQASTAARLLRALYHLPGNADVRVHLLVAALVTGWFSTELWIIAAYYNLRWIARYVLVARRLGGRR